MLRQNEIKKMLINYNRRLQKLKEQRALYGDLAVGSNVLLEIEDIETEMKNLQVELDDLKESGSQASLSSFDDVNTSFFETVEKSRPITGEKNKSVRGDGDNFTVSVGDHTSNVAIGKNIRQIDASAHSRTQLSTTQLAEIHQLFDNLRNEITAGVPSEKKEASLERIKELEETILSDEPDLTTVAYIKKWFVKNLPQLSSNLSNLLTHPTVSKVLR